MRSSKLQLNPNPKHIISTITGHRYIPTYSEAFLEDDYCEYDAQKEYETYLARPLHSEKERPTGDNWRSPSDVMIEDHVELKPPFTSRITRGTTQEGIFKIADKTMDEERNNFLKYVAGLLKESDSAWAHILDQEKIVIMRKVEEIYEKIYQSKCKVIQTEMSNFFEDNLSEIEQHVKDEVKSVIMSAQSDIINSLNSEIREKLKNEKRSLEKTLRKKFEKEVEKLNHYYELLLKNEKYKSSKLINQALIERNEALKAFCRMIGAENNTSTMYVMSTERRKCKIRQFFLEKFNAREIEDKIKKISEKQEILDEFLQKKKTILDLNKEWEEKIKKILQLFLKFLSFSLKLLPEQTTFLLDLEKLVVLQLNEIKKNPKMAPSMLIKEENITNLVKFDEKGEKSESTCEVGPFVIEGDIEPSIPTEYGSQETLPSHVDLPSVRVQRQFIYAKCQKMDDVRNLLESQRCKCRDRELYITSSTSSKDASSTTILSSTKPESEIESPSAQPSKTSFESYLIPDMQRLKECPIRDCKGFVRGLSFPNLQTYLDYDEDKYVKLTAILGDLKKVETPIEIIRPEDLTHYTTVPFEAIKDLKLNAETQYSSQDSLTAEVNVECNCLDQFANKPKTRYAPVPQKTVVEKLTEEKQSLHRIIHDIPQLLDLFFTDEKFDYKMT